LSVAQRAKSKDAELLIQYCGPRATFRFEPFAAAAWHVSSRSRYSLALHGSLALRCSPLAPSVASRLVRAFSTKRATPPPEYKPTSCANVRRSVEEARTDERAMDGKSEEAEQWERATDGERRTVPRQNAGRERSLKGYTLN